MDLRGSIWTILTEAANAAEALVLDPRIPVHDVARITRFINDVKKVLQRVLRPARNSRPAVLARLIGDLQDQCVGVLAGFAVPLDRAARRAQGLGKRRRGSLKRRTPTVRPVEVPVPESELEVERDEATGAATGSRGAM